MMRLEEHQLQASIPIHDRDNKFSTATMWSGLVHPLFALRADRSGCATEVLADSLRRCHQNGARMDEEARFSAEAA